MLKAPWAALLLVVSFGLSSCFTGELDVESLGLESNNAQYGHNGWYQLRAIGMISPSTQSGWNSRPASVELGWNWMPMKEGPIEAYQVFRANSPGSFDFNAPLAIVNQPYYQDHSVVTGLTYYYRVDPVVAGVRVPADSALAVVKMPVPPTNMALVHRWAANKTICDEMHRVTDKDNNNRCAYTGPGSVGGYYDIGASYFIDVAEAGCNYTSVDTIAASTQDYYVTAPSPDTYVPIAGTSTGLVGDDNGVSISIGFDFDYFGLTYSSVWIATNGHMNFINHTIHNNESHFPIGHAPTTIAPWWDDLYITSGSTVSYLLTGTSPNRVLTVQWGDAPHYVDGSAGDGVRNFQVRLYESTNEISFHYGNFTGTIDSASILIRNQEDTYTESGLGCNPTCGSTNWIVDRKITFTPSGNVSVGGADGVSYYNRHIGRCYTKVVGNWLDANDPALTQAVRSQLVSNAPGLPPLVMVDQNTASNYCNSLGKRLPTRSEQLIAAAWPSHLSVDDINFRESNSNLLSSTGSCNTNQATGVSFNDQSNSSDPEAIASTFSSTRRTIRTGGYLTQACSSTFGVQDLVGNVSEWTSDRLSSCDTATYTCFGAALTVDGNPSMFASVLFNGVDAPGGQIVGTMDIPSLRNLGAYRMNVPLGIPVVGGLDSVSTSYGGSDFDLNRVNGDRFRLENSSFSGLARAVVGGGDSTMNSLAGRYAVDFFTQPSEISPNVGFRCVQSAP
jgi:hypothetical protein